MPKKLVLKIPRSQKEILTSDEDPNLALENVLCEYLKNNVGRSALRTAIEKAVEALADAHVGQKNFMAKFQTAKERVVEAETQRKEPHFTHYVSYNGASFFVKEASFFASQGGLTQPWGMAWRGVYAKDIETARAIASLMFWGLTAPQDPDPAKHPFVFPEWFNLLPMQQQSVLVLALRGPDNVRKHHPCKEIQRHYRGTVLKAARYGRSLNLGEKADTFMSMDLMTKEKQSAWDQAVKDFVDHIDELPHHFIAHVMHGAEILGYSHPNELISNRWNQFYTTLVDDAHLNVESGNTMNDRLGDWGRQHWSK